MGVVGEQEYPSEGPIDLQPGDTIFVRTDGVDETMNPERELFGSERLNELLKTVSGVSADQVLTKVEEATAEHARGVEQDDDLTMIAIRIMD
ncbi:MAG: PP2C family protein-serine/threonine phosphatase, partial [Planctomycetota bacterium]|jgi:sigma-B regulation protein RsbU (phosphoserine phosphatase)